MQHCVLEIYVDCLNTTVRTDSQVSLHAKPLVQRISCNLQLFRKRLEELVNTNLPITLVQASRFGEAVALLPLDVALN